MPIFLLDYQWWAMRVGPSGPESYLCQQSKWIITGSYFHELYSNTAVNTFVFHFFLRGQAKESCNPIGPKGGPDFRISAHGDSM